jgi:hypothetical protein
MRPEDFFKELIRLYRKAKKQKYSELNIFRGRSISVSGEVEDLFAKFIAENTSKRHLYFVDQPMKFEGHSTKYPDIVIQDDEGGLIRNLIDIKLDLGWKKSTGIFDFCKEWDELIESVKDTETYFKQKQGHDKIRREGRFSKKLKYHVVVISKKNSGKHIEDDQEKVKKLKNVCLYVLSEGIHPNKYLSESEIMGKIIIHKDEFERLIDAIN